ncbi:hypothetical protein DXG01_016192 [Tephrocybe rancida]|nr:hypothetical protein DXG01_016192 [Tephrocybe rancida]
MSSSSSSRYQQVLPTSSSRHGVNALHASAPESPSSSDIDSEPPAELKRKRSMASKKIDKETCFLYTVWGLEGPEVSVDVPLHHLRYHSGNSTENINYRALIEEYKKATQKYDEVAYRFLRTQQKVRRRSPSELRKIVRQEKALIYASAAKLRIESKLANFTLAWYDTDIPVLHEASLRADDLSNAGILQLLGV